MKKALVLAFVAAAILAVAQSPEMNELSASTALGGKAVYDAIRHATKVTVQRVDTVYPPEDNPTGPTKVIDLGEPFSVPTAQADALKDAFLQRQDVPLALQGLPVPRECAVWIRGSWRQGHAGAVLRLRRDGGLAKRPDGFFWPVRWRIRHILKLTQALFPKDEFLAQFDEKIFQERVKRMEVIKP